MPSGQDQERAAATVATQLQEGRRVCLLFVCTHNARRSQMAQAWATLAFRELPAVSCASCGVERTQCHPSAVASLERAGWKVSPAGDGLSYDIAWPDTDVRCHLSSKLAADALSCSPQPTSEGETVTIAFFICAGDAISQCPRLPGITASLPWHYEDPGHADGTPDEQAAYDNASANIRAGIDALFQRVKQLCDVPSPL
eukprot:gene10447-2578_t